jgi:hypothetical protein
MSKITQDYVQEALGKEHVIVQQQHAIESLINMMTSLKADFSELQHSHRTAARAAVEKLNVLEPNIFSSYPHHDASDDVFIKAITAMQNHIKVIQRAFIFSERPFDFLVELCGYSNAVATAHKLSREQQKMLILHFIPTTSPIHKMIKTLPTLEAIFHYASTSSTIILTRADLEKQLDSWKLDTSSYNNLNMSLAVLKSLLMDINPGKFEMRNRSQLYIAMARQINRQKLTPWVYRSMEEVILKLEQENDESEMYSMILAVVKGLIKNTHFVPITHGIDSASSSFDGLNLKATTSKSTGNGTSLNKRLRRRKKKNLLHPNRISVKKHQPEVDLPLALE